MTINSNPSGHTHTIGAGNVLEKVLPYPQRVSSLWSWCWAGVGGAYLDTEVISGGDLVINDAVNLASPGTNDFFNNDTGDTRHGRPITFIGDDLPISVDGGAYSAPYPDLMYGGGSGTVQYLKQTTAMGATGEFYVAIAVYMERTSGDRYFAGVNNNGIKIGSVDRIVDVVINGVGNNLTASAAVPDKAIVEVWRDSSNNLHCWINGADATSGSPSNSGTFNFSGYGGAGAGVDTGDDWLFEQIACNALPTTAERLGIRNYLNDNWSMYT